MSIYNITASTFDHICSLCGKIAEGIPHAMLIHNATPWGETVLTYISCEVHGPTCGRPVGECGKNTDCVVHVESFASGLPASEETNENKSPEGREQIKNNRLLHKYNGLPVKP